MSYPGLSIQPNPLAARASQLAAPNRDVSTPAVRRVAGGERSAVAADDAGETGMADALRGDRSGQSLARRAGQDTIGLLQVAEGAMGAMLERLDRLRQVIARAKVEGAGPDNKAEAEQLVLSIDQIASNASYGQQHLLDGSFGVVRGTTNRWHAVETHTLLDGVPIYEGGARLGAPSPKITVTAGADAIELVVDGEAHTLRLPSGPVASPVDLQQRLASALSESGAPVQLWFATRGAGKSTTVDSGFQVVHTYVPAEVPDGPSPPPPTPRIDVVDRGLLGSLGVEGTEGSVGPWQASQPAGIDLVHLGAGPDDTVKVGLPDLRVFEGNGASPTPLGALATIDLVQAPEAASAAVEASAAALTRERSRVAAMEQRLTVAVLRLAISEENQAAAGARPDDISDQMVATARGSIVGSAGEAMSAQTAQLPRHLARLLG